MRNFALESPLIVEHEDAGRGVTLLLPVPPDPTAASTRVAVTAARTATRRRFVKPTSSSSGSLRVVREGVSAFRSLHFKWETKKPPASPAFGRGISPAARPEGFVGGRRSTAPSRPARGATSHGGARSTRAASRR